MGRGRCICRPWVWKDDAIVVKGDNVTGDGGVIGEWIRFRAG